jgi:hypothetical protein
MSPAKGRTQTCGKTEAHTRLTHARAFTAAGYPWRVTQ